MKGRGYEVVKRACDVVMALLLIITLSPVLVLAAIAVKIDGTGGRVLVDEPRRVGKDGILFRMLKFRTMVPGAHEQLMKSPEYRELRKKLADTGKLKIEEDPRITSAGRLLRKWDIDELPQLWNVITGKMSLVGPRPYLGTEIENYVRNNRTHKKEFEKILSVRPGVTGLWQVSGRNEVKFAERVRMDSDYVATMSLAGDLKILLRTPYAVLFRVGAW
jgi:lipopolysaccharide/colanic/teichoic acid biosynthesis glycosyltransferase